MGENSLKYIASCSFGKDSFASVLLAIEHDEPLDEVVYCEVMFDANISGEVPEHRNFIYEKAIPYLERHGIETTIVRSEKTYISEFFHTVGSGSNTGKIWGWPLCGRCFIQRDCKARVLERYGRTLLPGTRQYIGIADDEQDRLLRLESNTQISLLQKYKISKDMTPKICAKHGLLSPVYAFANRNGCFFCPNAKFPELRHLYDHHPDLWARLLKLQQVPNKCTEYFNRDFRFDEIDSRFQLEDAQLSFFDALT